MMFESLSWRTTLTSGSFTHARELCRCDNLNPALIYFALDEHTLQPNSRLLVRNKNVQDNNPRDRQSWVGRGRKRLATLVQYETFLIVVG